MATNNDALSFADELAPDAGSGERLPPWRVLVVDDNADVHEATLYALKGLHILDRPLEFLHAHSAAAALEILKLERDIAAILLDVVMETANSGLDLVAKVRHDLGLRHTRIILRTGQPGHAPDVDTVRNYDINDYHTKSELTRGRLFAALSTAIRAYDQFEKAAASRHFLERVVAASHRLIAQPDQRTFSLSLLAEIGELLGVPLQGVVFAITPQCTAEDNCQVIAATGHFTHCLHRRMGEIDDAATLAAMRHCLQARSSVIEPYGLTLYLAGVQPGHALIVRAASDQPLPEIDRQLLDMLCSNIALGAERVELTDQLRRQAFFDALVDLPNRNAFIESVDRRIDIDGGADYVLALIDVDQFAEINDMFGHEYGDHLLQAMARRLEDRVGDGILIARVGTDTFGLLGRAGRLQPVELRDVFATPFALAGNDHVVSVSMGLVRLGETGGRGADQLKDASIALKRAKTGGHGQTAWYSVAISNETRERTRLLHALREAFNYERLYVVYQPQVSLSTGALIGFEALLRWRSEDGLFVPPDAFIPIAENSGLIVGLGSWVLRTALRAAGEIRRAGHTDFHMAVNVSAVQFRHPDFLTMLDAALADTGARPQDVELEITESVAMMGAEVTVANFAALKARGIALALDDFGTGFSSLSYLDQLPADRIKIDRSFVWALESDKRGARIAEMVIPLGRQLGMKVLAEGVENEAQAQRLRELGADEAQGYLYARPQPLPELLEWLKDRTRA